MPDSLYDVLAGSFMPHGHCYLWQPEMVWLQVLSNGTIGLSYVAISATIYHIIRQIEELPFQRIYFAFGVFIISCGFTHFCDVLTVWRPYYWLDGGVRAITALASAATALLLLTLAPKAIALAGTAKLAHARGLELEESVRNLNRANEELVEAHRRAVELERAKTDFFAKVSHELRTPLTLVTGPVERLLASAGLAPEQRRQLEVVDKNARALLAHVNDLLDVAKVEAGGLAPRYRRSDLSEVVRASASLFEVAAQQGAITLSVEAPSALEAECDAAQLRRVVTNLLSNAFKYAPPGGHVTVRLEERDGSAHFAVEDDGPGVPEGMEHVVFERYRQIGGEGQRAGGTGLGLAIAKEFVELHGGSVRVEKAPGGGARFVVELPLEMPEAATAPPGTPAAISADATALAAGVASVAGTAGGASDEAGERPLVLVVDDNDGVRHFVAEVLGAVYRVVTASDGSEGLAKAAELRPDLVVSDLMMPRMGGDELLAAMRARPELNDTPVLLLSARADDQLRAALLRAGANDYAVKPFSPEELVARAGNLVTMKRAREVLRRELSTERGNVEALASELAQRHRELELALGRVREARDRAERASQIKTNVLNVVSHEIRTPLASSLLWLELLRRRAGAALAAPESAALAKAVGGVGRAAELLDSMLEYANLQSEAVNRSPVDLPALVGEIVGGFRDEAERKGLRLLLRHPDALPPLVTDARIVRLLVRNLVANAVSFTPEGEVEIEVSVGPAGEQGVAVRDTGPGIDPERQSLVFEPFEHHERITHKHLRGLGLGLAIVKRAADALGGSVALHSEAGRGCTVTATLPSLPALPA